MDPQVSFFFGVSVFVQPKGLIPIYQIVFLHRNLGVCRFCKALLFPRFWWMCWSKAIFPPSRTPINVDPRGAKKKERERADCIWLQHVATQFFVFQEICKFFLEGRCLEAVRRMSAGADHEQNTKTDSMPTCGAYVKGLGGHTGHILWDILGSCCIWDHDIFHHWGTKLYRLSTSRINAYRCLVWLFQMSIIYMRW